ncbi:MAG: hypothetical protein K6L73_13690 [Cellvibrionaceae bacterium]
MMRSLLAIMTLVLLINTSYAQEGAVLEIDDTIVGNQEQPRVMNIIPWQPPSGPDHLYSPLRMSDLELFQTIERSEFLRYIERKKISSEQPGAEAQADSPSEIQE